MMIKQKTSLLIGPLMVMSFIVTGCANIAGTSEPTNFYRLTAIETTGTLGTTTANMADLQIGIGPISVPGYADRPQIVTNGAAGRLIVNDLNHWAEPLQDNIGRVLVSNLAAKLSASQVYPYPASFTPSPDSYQISIEINEVIQGKDGKAYLTATWNVKRMRDNRLVLRQTERLESASPIDGFSELATSLSAMLGKLSQSILKSLSVALG
jgi:uncharacterized protein